MMLAMVVVVVVVVVAMMAKKGFSIHQHSSSEPHPSSKPLAVSSPGPNSQHPKHPLEQSAVQHTHTYTHTHTHTHTHPLNPRP